MITFQSQKAENGNIIPITSIVAEFPRSGQWIIDLKIINPKSEDIYLFEQGTLGLLTIDDIELIGTIISSNINNNSTILTCRLIAGDGLICLPTKSQNSINSSAKNIAEEIKNDTGDNKNNSSNLSLGIDNNINTSIDLTNKFEEYFGIPIYNSSSNIPTNLSDKEKEIILSDFNQTFKLGNINSALENTDKLEKNKLDLKKQKEYNQSSIINEHSKIESLLTNTVLLQYQKLNKVDAGKQLTKLLRNRTKDNNTVWRKDETGLFIFFCNDLDQKRQTLIPTDSILEEINFNGSITIDSFYLDYLPEPGTWFIDSSSSNLWRVEHVTIYVNDNRIKIVLKKNTFTQITKAVTTNIHEEAFQRNYTATISEQNSDGTVNLFPDDDLLKGTGLANIPIRTPFGVSVKCEPGINVVVQYENNDPSKPYIIGFYELNQDQHSDFSNSSNYFLTIGNPLAISFAARADKTDSAINSIESKLNDLIKLFNNHTHTVTTTGTATSQTGTTAPTLTIETPISSSDSTASKRLKIE